MILEDLIGFLEKQDLDKVIPVGFNNPHSYRGSYYDLAFEPKENVTFGEMLSCAKEALGTTYIGWKGGDFEMNECTDVHIAFEGETGESIGIVLLEYMVRS